MHNIGSLVVVLSSTLTAASAFADPLDRAATAGQLPAAPSSSPCPRFEGRPSEWTGGWIDTFTAAPTRHVHRGHRQARRIHVAQ